MEKYDYIFAGMGCASLSLVYRLNHSPLRNQKILLIDKAPKNQNDRTWSFWTKDTSLFEPVVSKNWEKVWFHSPTFSKLLDLKPYQYKMIRGIDFYRFVLEDIAQNPQIEIKIEPIKEILTEGDCAIITTQHHRYQANWGFNSLPPQLDLFPQKYHYLKQHFLGWRIQTTQPIFNLNEPTFMDFRIPQNGEARFVYILPSSEREALVEFTIFSENLLPREAYSAALQNYLNFFLHLTDYQIEEEEFGVIPMTNQPLNILHSPRVLNIGSAGGRTKASTGYTFMNIQRQSDAIFQQLLKKQHPIYPIDSKQKYWWYDSILLNVMAKNRYNSAEVFRSLFQKHSPERILRFLDEETSFWEDLQIMASVPSIPFIKAFWDVAKRIR